MKEKYLRTPGPKRTLTRYFVPKQFLQNIQQQEFWDGVQPDDITALRIEKSVGIRYEYREGNWDEDWDSENSREGAWPLENDDNGLVVRHQSDPSAARVNQPFDLGRRERYEELQ